MTDKDIDPPVWYPPGIVQAVQSNRPPAVQGTIFDHYHQEEVLRVQSREVLYRMSSRWNHWGPEILSHNDSILKSIIKDNEGVLHRDMKSVCFRVLHEQSEPSAECSVDSCLEV